MFKFKVKTNSDLQALEIQGLLKKRGIPPAAGKKIVSKEIRAIYCTGKTFYSLKEGCFYDTIPLKEYTYSELYLKLKNIENKVVNIELTTILEKLEQLSKKDFIEYLKQKAK